MSLRRGFTLIELLLVVAIISALAVAVFVALNPAKRLQDTNDAKRATDVDTILSAIHSNIVDGKGVWPTGLSATLAERQLGSAGSGCAIVTSPGGCVVANDACLDLSTPLTGYLKSVPVDPTATDPTITGYSVSVANGVVTVRACNTQGATPIYTSR